MKIAYENYRVRCLGMVGRWNGFSGIVSDFPELTVGYIKAKLQHAS
ncbi:MAG TPA: hypothetical protein VFM69_14065 [Pricia sp.]|nr:hypothetical protein [Pricia sp.]